MKPVSSQTEPCNTCLEPRLSIISVLCRICYDSDKDEALIAPCHCKGTVAFVHRSCLERWLAESNTTMCELCHVIFQTERSPKYTSKQSIWRWLRSDRTPGGIGRGVRSDIIACTVITPVAIIITYVCLFSSDYYNQKKFIMVPAARWTSVSLLIMIGIMLVGYYLWVYSVIRLHSRMWYNWWQRECTVRYIPPSSAHICCHNAHEILNPNNTPNTPTSTETSDEYDSSRTRLETEILTNERCLEQSVQMKSDGDERDESREGNIADSVVVDLTTEVAESEESDEQNVETRLNEATSVVTVQKDTSVMVVIDLSEVEDRNNQMKVHAESTGKSNSKTVISYVTENEGNDGQNIKSTTKGAGKSTDHTENENSRTLSSEITHYYMESKENTETNNEDDPAHKTTSNVNENTESVTNEGQNK